MVSNAHVHQLTGSLFKNQRWSTAIIPGWVRRKERESQSKISQPFRIYSDVVFTCTFFIEFSSAHVKYAVWIGSYSSCFQIIHRVHRSILVTNASFKSLLRPWSIMSTIQYGYSRCFKRYLKNCLSTFLSSFANWCTVNCFNRYLPKSTSDLELVLAVLQSF